MVTITTDIHLPEQVHVSTDKNRLNNQLVIDFLHSTYWAKETPSEKILKSIEHSMCFGLYRGDEQIGFARVITDFTYSAWLADVFIVSSFQGKGYGQVLMNAIITHPDLRDVHKWRLSTVDAHSFYEKFGFTAVRESEKLMERIL